MDILVILVVLLKYLAIALVTFLAGVWVFFLWNNGYWRRRGVVDDGPVPILGSLKHLMRKSTTEYLIELAERFPRDYVGVFLAHEPTLVVQSPDLARRVLVKDSDKFQNRRMYAPTSDPLGSLCLLNLKNPMWSVMRRECSPMFTSSRLRKLADLMNINANHLVQRIDRNIKENKKMELKDLFTMYTSDTVAYTVYGLRASALSGEPNPLWVITQHITDWTFWRGFEFTMVFLVPLVAAVMRLCFFSVPATKYIREMFYTVVEERKKSASGVKEKDVVSLLLRIKENMKLPANGDPELADNLMLAQTAIFILGAVDTSATTLTYLMHELAFHPEEQEKLYNELREAKEKSGKEFLEFYEQHDLRYMTACIQETLRKFPPLGYVDRICSEEFKVDDSLTLEKGAAVMVNVVGMHRNPDLYPEPMEWRPSRFSGENETDNRNFTWLPFGDGPRFCIGKRYGFTQIRAALTQIVLHYRIEPSSDPYHLPLNPYTVLVAPASGGNVTFVPRA